MLTNYDAAFYYSFCYDLPEQGEPEKDVFDNDKPLTIVWDYNLGLVRMAGMFRALGFAKVRSPLPSNLIP